MNELRLIFWETTRGCNLRCIHCRADAELKRSPDELTQDEAEKFIDEVVSFSKPILILSGGEPLYRDDIFDIAKYASDKGLHVALASNGTLITPEIAQKIKDSGIMRVSISIDGADAQTHDGFRGISGSFDKAILAIKYLQDKQIGTQINTTVSKHNVASLDKIIQLVRELKVNAFHVFMLVPVGCGVQIEETNQIEALQYEKVLEWLYEESKKPGLEIKATCAPHYYRIIRQKGAKTQSKGCLAGSNVCFLSYKGDIQPCGYLAVKVGNIRAKSFKNIWEHSDVFQKLRDPTLLGGKCGYCEYRFVCEGCRARAYAKTGNFLDEEPFCVYEPKRQTTA